MEKVLTKKPDALYGAFFGVPMAAADGISHLTAAQMTAAIPRAEPVKSRSASFRPLFQTEAEFLTGNSRLIHRHGC